MRIGKTDHAFTAICTPNAETITVRGHDLCADLIGKIDFSEYFWPLVLGEKPAPKQRAMLDACLVAIAEHGLVPSVQAARVTLAAAPDAWQGAMSAGLLGMGTVVAGSTDVAGRYVGILRFLGEHAPGIINRPLPINVSGAIPAVILDAGCRWTR